MNRSERTRNLREPLRLLFVCTGNTCRSPMAAALARAVAQEMGSMSVEVRSAGTNAAAGHPASDGARAAASRQGLDLSGHRSRPLTPELVDWADRIFTMGPHHLMRVEDMGGEGKGAVLGSYAQGLIGSSNDFAVPDPFGGDERLYEETLLTLEIYVRKALRRIKSEERS